MRQLKHPLVFDIPYSPVKNALFNKQYTLKTEEAVRLAGNKGLCCLCIPSRETLQAGQFMECVKFGMMDLPYWELLKEIWVNSENIWQNVDIWRELLSSTREHKEYFMGEENLALFAALPDKINILPRIQEQQKTDYHGLPTKPLPTVSERLFQRSVW